MDQQRSATVRHIIKCFSSLSHVPNLCPDPKLSLINRLINGRPLDAWPTVIQTSPQLINISHRI